MGELRGRKRQRTHRQIGEAALRLFIAHGFDRVTIAQIAAAAEVSEKTVYNYFPTKAHLVFDEDDTVLADLVAALRERAAGESALTAIRRALSRVGDRLGEGRLAEERATFYAMIADSAALQDHQRAITARYERTLARVLAEQTGELPGAVEPFVAAVALIGALRAGVEHSASGEAVSASFERALDLLATGLADYAAVPSEHSSFDRGCR